MLNGEQYLLEENQRASEIQLHACAFWAKLNPGVLQSMSEAIASRRQWMQDQFQTVSAITPPFATPAGVGMPLGPGGLGWSQGTLNAVGAPSGSGWPQPGWEGGDGAASVSAGGAGFVPHYPGAPGVSPVTPQVTEGLQDSLNRQILETMKDLSHGLRIRDDSRKDEEEDEVDKARTVDKVNALVGLEFKQTAPNTDFDRHWS